MKNILLKIAPHAAAVIIFLIIAQLFFSIENADYSLRQSDIEHVMGMSKELVDYRMMNDGQEALWSNNMFGGMPGYQTNVLYPSNILRQIDAFIKLYQYPASGTLFMCMLGFYIFCLCVRINPWLGIAAGIAFGLSTINVLYLGAGHTSKVNAIAYMAPALGGVLLAYRGKWILGAAVFALFFGLHVAASHLQMTYYLAFLLGAVALAEFIHLLVKKEWIYALKTSAVLLAATIISILPNLGSLLTTYEYSKLTTRGKSDLTITAEGATKDDADKEGLKPDYILQYNMAAGEWFSVFLPNAKGGNSAYIKSDKKVLQTVPSKLREQVGDMNRYWGEQEFSGGAFYFGAFIMFLFAVALIFSKDNLKWPFLALTLLVIALSVKELTKLNTFFIFDFPYYNKFRDHKMMLVLLQVMAPALAFIFIDSLLKTELNAKLRKFLLIGTGAVLVIGAVLCLVPTASGELMSAGDKEMFDQYEAQYEGNGNALNQIDDMRTALINVRSEIYKEDGKRSLLLFVIAAFLLVGLALQKLKWYVLAPALALVITGDMWTASERYMNDSKREGQYLHYVKTGDKYFPYSPDKCDMAILEKEKINVPNFESEADALQQKYLSTTPYKNVKDKAKPAMAAQFGALGLNSNYRVLLGSRGVFTDASIPYFHKSLGGYHAAKLKRYQEIIDFYLTQEINAFSEALQSRSIPKVDSVLATSKIINMLNAKYVKYAAEAPPIENKNAMGNAWFVKDIAYAASADEEISKIATTDISNTAVVHNDFKQHATSASGIDSTSVASLTEYGTNYFKYTAATPVAAPLIFSEIYYPEGWICKIDNNEVPYFRANYILRGVQVPAGEHTIEWNFEPASYKKGVTLNWIGSFTLLGVLLLVFGWNIKSQIKIYTDSKA
jgi:hypothetical protein